QEMRIDLGYQHIQLNTAVFQFIGINLLCGSLQIADQLMKVPGKIVGLAKTRRCTGSGTGLNGCQIFEIAVELSIEEEIQADEEQHAQRRNARGKDEPL